MDNKTRRARYAPYRFFAAAAILAALFTLTPMPADAPPEYAKAMHSPAPAQDMPAGADLSDRTQTGAYLHRTSLYTPCGHSVQRREPLPAALTGLSRSALEQALPAALPGAVITGFSAQEVDISLTLPIPCPLHWMLIAGKDGQIHVQQNLTGERLETVRRTDLDYRALPSEEQALLLEGMIFDDVQAMESYLESLSS